MYVKVQTKEKKLYDRIQKCGHWHKVFVFWPREVDSANGQKEFAFFTTLYRKAELHYSAGYEGSSSGIRFRFRHRKPDDGMMQALAEGDCIEFGDSDARKMYLNLKEKLDAN